jgi:hypothetical protein
MLLANSKMGKCGLAGGVGGHIEMINGSYDSVSEVQTNES